MEIKVLLEYVVGRFVPGVYTLAVSEALPEEMQVCIFFSYIVLYFSVSVCLDFDWCLGKNVYFFAQKVSIRSSL